MRIGLGISLGASSIPWSPNRLGAERFLWLRADAASLGSPTDGAAIASWSDVGGGGSYTQATGAKQPAYTAAAMSGRGGVTFGSGKVLQRTLSVASTDYLYVAAIDVTTATGVASFLFGDATRVIAPVDGNTGVGVAYYDTNWRVVAATTTGVQVLAWDLRAATGGKVYKNGTQLAGNPTFTAHGLTNPIVGFDSVASFKGVLGEIVGVSTSGMSVGAIDTLRGQLTRYVGSRYGITVA